MSRTEQQIIKFISVNGLVQEGDKLLIALSGGSDSVFALNFFNKFKNKYKISICALHINHSLRGEESYLDQEFCKDICNIEEIEFYTELVDVNKLAKEKKLSIEETGRIIRYQKLEEYSRISNSNKIVTAHNLEDNTETILLNLFRGTGLKGISGIPIKRDNIIRPFLSTSKNEIENYLNEKKIKFVVDSSNKESIFKRNFLRNEILPKIRQNINDNVDLNIFKLSEIVRKSYIMIEEVLDRYIKKFVSDYKSGIKISKQVINEKPELINELIKKVIDQKFSRSLEYKNIFRIEQLFHQQVGTKIILQDGLEAISEREYIVVKFDDEQKDNEVKLELNSTIELQKRILGCVEINIGDVNLYSGKEIEFIDSEKLTFPLYLRTWREGDKFNPLGLKGTKKLSDFLTDQKVPNAEKKKQFVLLNKEKIVWVVGFRIDKSVKITEKTKKVIKLWVK